MPTCTSGPAAANIAVVSQIMGRTTPQERPELQSPLATAFRVRWVPTRLLEQAVSMATAGCRGSNHVRLPGGRKRGHPGVRTHYLPCQSTQTHATHALPRRSGPGPFRHKSCRYTRQQPQPMPRVPSPLALQFQPVEEISIFPSLPVKQGGLLQHSSLRPQQCPASQCQGPISWQPPPGAPAGGDPSAEPLR